MNMLVEHLDLGWPLVLLEVELELIRDLRGGKAGPE
jgi:hypothetical protein